MNPIISIPHSNQLIPKEFHSQYAQPIKNFNKHIDFGVDTFCKINGYTIIEADVSRFVVDLNRKRDDINSDQGVIINKDWNNNQVLKQKLTDKEIEERLKKYYDPFYSKLKNLLRSKNLFLLDCHSMDSKNHSDKSDRPDICLANNFGKTCPKSITELIKKEFKKESYWVEENNPYNGKRAKIITFANEYSAPSMELEFNKKIYMDEDSLTLNNQAIIKLRKIITKILNKLK